MSAANVRSLLRNERKARRIEHPHATYSAAGVLSCQLCHIQIKAESIWDQHTRGSHHRGQLQRFRAAQASKAVAAARSDSDPTKDASASAAISSPSGDPSAVASAFLSATTNKRKRAADDGDDEDEHGVIDPEDARKKTKALRPAAAEVVMSPVEPELESEFAAATGVDEAEWEAFTRDVVASPPRAEEKEALPLVLMASASISAAPITAAEVAANSREEASRQAREKREADMENEVEDAADRIAEEIEEQEVLLERVNRLKEKREALRRKAAEEEKNEAQKTESVAHEMVEAEGEDSQEDEDEFDDWFRH